MTVEILLPVTYHALQVTSAPAGTETRLEMLVLRYVHHLGATDVPHVARAFGLRHRVALGVALSLWREGSLLVDLHRGDIRVTPEVAGLCESGDLEALNERRRRIDEQEVVLEPISGFVGLFTDTARPTRGAGALIAPAPANPVDITAVMQKDLLGVVLRAQRSSGTYEQSDRRIVEVGLSSPISTNVRAGASRFLPVEISVSRGFDDDDVNVRVLADGNRLTALQRRRVETFLLDLVNDRPDERLAATIRSEARGPLLAPPTIGDRIQLMRQRATHPIEGITSDRAQSEHDLLVDQAIAVDRDLSDRDRSAACSIELLTSPTEIRATSGDLIRNARDQIVIVSPWIRRPALNKLYDDLRDALDRNVDVVILWGIGDGDTLDPDVLNMLSSLSGPGRQTPGRLLVGRRSARTHAKLLVQDDRALLLSSHNLLSSDDGRTEVGLLVSDGDRQSPPVLGEALRWVQNAFPSYQQARTFLLQNDPPYASSELDLPTPPTSVEDALAIDAWQRAWQEHVGTIERRHRDVRLHVRGLIENQRHRQMLTEALQQADRRVLATGQRLTAQSINQAILGEFRRYLSRTGDGVLVLVHESGEDAEEEVSEALDALAQEFPGRCAIQAVERWHAKALVWDDESVVSSFNFLSFEGGYRNRGSRMRSELGVHVSGRDLSDQLFDAVMAASGVSGLEVTPAPPNRAHERPPIVLTVDSTWEHIRPLLALDPSVAGEAFLARVAPERREDVVEALAAVDGYEELAAQLAAAALDSSTVLPRWELKLGLDAWERGEFLLAHAILPADVPEPSIPLRVIAAALESPSIGSAIAAFDPSDFNPSERSALLLAGIWAVLNGHPEALSLLTGDEDDFPELRRAAIGYFERSLGRPAPWDDLHAHDFEAERAERTAVASSAILDSLDQFERSNSLSFEEGSKLRKYWRGAGSSFASLREILGANASAEVWLHTWGDDAAEFLARNCQAGATGEIHLGIQPGLQKRLDRLLEQVRRYELLHASGRDLDGLNEITERIRVELRRAAASSEVDASAPDVANVVTRRCRQLLFGSAA